MAPLLALSRLREKRTLPQVSSLRWIPDRNTPQSFGVAITLHLRASDKPVAMDVEFPSLSP
jgi:hypothetical protein